MLMGLHEKVSIELFNCRKKCLSKREANRHLLGAAGKAQHGCGVPGEEGVSVCQKAASQTQINRLQNCGSL